MTRRRCGVRMTSFPSIDVPNGGDFQLAWEDDERAFFSGRGNAGDDRQAVLAVISVAEPGRLNDSGALICEYELKEELEETWAVQPQELLRQSGRTILILQDHGFEPLDRLLGSPMEPGRFLQIAVGLSSATRKMHDRGLIHKNIKPSRPAKIGDRLTTRHFNLHTRGCPANNKANIVHELPVGRSRMMSCVPPRGNVTSATSYGR